MLLKKKKIKVRLCTRAGNWLTEYIAPVLLGIFVAMLM